MRIKAWLADWRLAFVCFVFGAPGFVDDIQAWGGWLTMIWTYIAVVI